MVLHIRIVPIPKLDEVKVREAKHVRTSVTGFPHEHWIKQIGFVYPPDRARLHVCLIWVIGLN